VQVRGDVGWLVVDDVSVFAVGHGCSESVHSIVGVGDGSDGAWSLRSRIESGWGGSYEMPLSREDTFSVTHGWEGEDS
jgi:hypothetical protein